MSEQKPDGRLASDLCDQLGPMVESAGMVNVLNHGSGSCVYSEGCHGVTQEHLERFAALLVAAKPHDLYPCKPLYDQAAIEDAYRRGFIDGQLDMRDRA